MDFIKRISQFIVAISLSSASAFAQTNNWAVTATPFKIVGEETVNNVKVNWEMRADATSYKVYRDGTLIGETLGDTYDDYGLDVPSSHDYYVVAVKDGQALDTSVSQKAQTFVPTGKAAKYDNLDGRYIVQGEQSPGGFKIGNRYYSYQINHIEKTVGDTTQRGWQVTERISDTGLGDTWSASRELAFYPGVKFECCGFRYNPLTGKVVLAAHYEDGEGYSAAKIYLAQITPHGGIEVGTMARPLGCESRDQSLFVDDDNTAYLLSAARMNSDINIYRLDETWTKPVALVNTVFVNQHRETPVIVKRDGTYYFFSSKASGWYPSQAMYASSTTMDGEWTALREMGNNTTFDAQVNNVQRRGTVRETYGLWSYHWGAQRKYKTAAGNFPRISIMNFNAGYASADYYRYVEFYTNEGMVPVQMGRNLTLGANVFATTVSKNGASPTCITDGADMNTSPYFQGNECPYALTVDMGREAEILEINLSTRLTNGSETAYKYTIEGSCDGQNYELLVDGKNNWQIGFLILPVSTTTPYRYLRLNVLGAVNVHNGNDAAWAEGVYELAAFGKWK